MTLSPVALVVPPGTPGTTPNREGASGLGAVVPRPNGFRYPLHTVAIVAAVLRERGFNVHIIDAVARGFTTGDCIQQALDASGEIIAVYVSWATQDIDRAFIELLRRACGDRRVVAFGISTQFMLDSLGSAHHVLLGEPECGLASVCERLSCPDAALPHVVTTSDVMGDIYDSRGLLTDLDALPYPAWDLFPVDTHRYLTVSSSRGCESDCAWCPYVLAQGHVYRAMSPARTVAELAELVGRYHPRRIVFRDPAFAHDTGRVEAICRLIVTDPLLRPGKNLLWECESRPEHLTPPLLRLMSLAGCVGIKIGLETTDPDVLCEQHRVARPARVPAYLAHVASLARTCVYWGIGYRVFVMAGLPGQDVAAAQDTAAFVRALHPTSLSIKPFIVYPGVELREAPRGDAPVPVQVERLHEAQQALGVTDTGIESRITGLMARWRRVFGRQWIRWCAKHGATSDVGGA